MGLLSDWYGLLYDVELFLRTLVAPGALAPSACRSLGAPSGHCAVLGACFAVCERDAGGTAARLGGTWRVGAVGLQVTRSVFLWLVRFLQGSKLLHPEKRRGLLDGAAGLLLMHHRLMPHRTLGSTNGVVKQKAHADPPRGVRSKAHGWLVASQQVECRPKP